jgi:hypothetical protein
MRWNQDLTDGTITTAINTASRLLMSCVSQCQFSLRNHLYHILPSQFLELANVADIVFPLV